MEVEDLKKQIEEKYSKISELQESLDRSNKLAQFLGQEIQRYKSLGFIRKCLHFNVLSILISY